jgi:hypothetical protein
MQAIDHIDPNLTTFASEAQAKYIEAVNQHGSIRAAAKALDMSEAGVRQSLERLRKSAAIRGYSPEHNMTRPVPDTHVAKGVSTMYDADGKVRAQWVKSNLRQEAYNEAVRDAISSFVSDVLPLPAPEGPKDYSSDVIPWIQIGDAHIGMLAHAAEVAENFDLKIAERELCGAIGALIDEMPPTERVVINDVGDMTHYENFTATTEASGHALDYDSRFPKMIKAYARIMRFIVDKALTKAQHVDVIINQGNHSRTNDIWMATLLAAVYAHTGRVHVLNNDSVFIGYRMGKTFVMTHHSDKCKPERLASVMAHDFREDFGATEFHYVDVGHIHHRSVAVDLGTVVVESWNHLAARDKWAHEAGYRSSKSITVVLRSRTYGEIGRRTLSIQELRDRLYGAGHKTLTRPTAFVA